MDTDSLALTDIRPRLRAEARAQRSLDGFYLTVGNNCGNTAEMENADDTRSRDQSRAAHQISAIKHVTGKERKIHFFPSIRPLSALCVQRHKGLVFLAEQSGSNS